MLYPLRLCRLRGNHLAVSQASRHDCPLVPWRLYNRMDMHLAPGGVRYPFGAGRHPPQSPAATDRPKQLYLGPGQWPERSGFLAALQHLRNKLRRGHSIPSPEQLSVHANRPAGWYRWRGPSPRLRSAIRLGDEVVSRPTLRNVRRIPWSHIVHRNSNNL